MSYQLTLPPAALLQPKVFGFEDHFVYDSDIWADAIDDGGSITAGTLFGGQCVITTDADNNDEAYRASGAVFQFAADKPLVATARLKFTEAATNAANILFGLQTDLNADALIDDGGGPATSSAYNAVWYKVDGETRWRVRSSVNGTATTHETQYTSGGGAWQTLRIEYLPKSSGIGEVTFWIDENGGYDFVQAREFGAHPRQPAIRHEMSSLAGGVVGLIFGAKAGGDQAEVLNVDYANCWQRL